MCSFGKQVIAHSITPQATKVPGPQGPMAAALLGHPHLEGTDGVLCADSVSTQPTSHAGPCLTFMGQDQAASFLSSLRSSRHCAVGHTREVCIRRE